MRSIDLNCDMGESFGPWKMGNDAALMKYISSANIACGFHAGDASTMNRTVELAMEHNVAIGAHPGFPDLQGFGRRTMSFSPQEIFDQVLYQVSALKGICEANGASLTHVKPHGAMYNQAAADAELSKAIVDAVKSLDPSLIVYGLSGSLLIEAAAAAGMKTASEVFADRTYRSDGSLTPRSETNALILDTRHAVRQAMQMIEHECVTATDGSLVKLTPDTICIHGDGAQAVEFAAAVRAEFDKSGITVRPPN